MIVISPYSRSTFNPHPKNFPHWQDVVNALVRNGQRVIQVGLEGEHRLDGAEVAFNMSFRSLKNLVSTAAAWGSVDNFFPHMCAAYKLGPGVVVWSKSDPLIYGYPTNVNLLKSRDFLRHDQFGPWDCCAYQSDAFVSHELVTQSLMTLATLSA